MYYKELLRTRRTVLICALSIAVTGAFIVIINLAAAGSSTATPHRFPVPIELLFGIGGFAAAIVATALGGSLSGDGARHIELVGTRPISRNAYAVQVLLINALGIVAVALMTTAVTALVWSVVAKDSTIWQAGPDTAFNAVRFLLFPLAWYALVQAMTVGYRAGAGVAQACVWPVALTLLVFLVIPIPAIWHKIFVVLNVLNPLAYTTYEVSKDGTATPTGFRVALDAMALGALALGWAATAMFRWRRIEA